MFNLYQQETLNNKGVFRVAQKYYVRVYVIPN